MVIPLPKLYGLFPSEAAPGPPGLCTPTPPPTLPSPAAPSLQPFPEGYEKLWVLQRKKRKGWLW